MRGDAWQGVGCASNKEETDHRRLNDGDVFLWCSRCAFNRLKGREINSDFVTRMRV